MPSPNDILKYGLGGSHPNFQDVGSIYNKGGLISGIMGLSPAGGALDAASMYQKGETPGLSDAILAGLTLIPGGAALKGTGKLTKEMLHVLKGGKEIPSPIKIEKAASEVQKFDWGHLTADELRDKMDDPRNFANPGQHNSLVDEFNSRYDKAVKDHGGATSHLSLTAIENLFSKNKESKEIAMGHLKYTMKELTEEIPKFKDLRAQQLASDDLADLEKLYQKATVQVVK